MSQVFNLPTVACAQRSADYKSAIRQIKNLRYAKQIPSSPRFVRNTAFYGDEPQPQPWIRGTDLVTKDAQRAVVVVDDEVDRAIVVEVARREPPPDFGELERGTAGRRAFLEFAVAQIVKELLPLMDRIPTCTRWPISRPSPH